MPSIVGGLLRSSRNERARAFCDATGAGGAHQDLRIGDLVFIRVTARPFLEVASATCSWVNHVGIVIGARGNDSLIAESTFPLSRVTTLTRFLARSEHGVFAVARLRQPLESSQ
jgi:hypothetical protein